MFGGTPRDPSTPSTFPKNVKNSIFPDPASSIQVPWPHSTDHLPTNPPTTLPKFKCLRLIRPAITPYPPHSHSIPTKHSYAFSAFHQHLTPHPPRPPLSSPIHVPMAHSTDSLSTHPHPQLMRLRLIPLKTDTPEIKIVGAEGGWDDFLFQGPGSKQSILFRGGPEEKYVLFHGALQLVKEIKYINR